MNVAQKYAVAFLNVWGEQITSRDIEGIAQAADFLYTHRRALFLLKVSLIDEAIKQQGLDELCERFELPNAIHSLIDLLLKKKRASKLAAIFEAIVAQYRKQHKEDTIIVTSSCALSPSQKKTVERFADTQFPGIKKYEYRIDKSLIAGLRMQSSGMMWERSLDKYLRDCAQSRVW